MDFPVATKPLLHKIDVFYHPRINGRDLTRVVTAEDVIHIVQSGEIIFPIFVTIPHKQPLIRMDVIERQFAVGQCLSPRMREGSSQ